MSLRSWRKQYIEPMSSFIIKSLKRDIKKWQGLRPPALAAHRCVAYYDGDVYQAQDIVDYKEGANIPSFPVDMTTCNQCVNAGLYDPHRDNFGEGNCDPCLVYRSRGYVTCSEPIQGVEEISPWHVWTEHCDPEPMLVALEKALQWFRDQKKEAKKEKEK